MNMNMKNYLSLLIFIFSISAESSDLNIKNINPQIDQTYKKSIQEEEEGCLSIPEVRLVAERYDKIKVVR